MRVLHNQKKIEAIGIELAYWQKLADGGEAGEVAVETRRMARKIVKRLNKDLAKLVKEEVQETR